LKTFQIEAYAEMSRMPTSYTFGPFQLDAELEVLFCRSVPTALGRRGVSLLRVLVERPGSLVSKEKLVDAVWTGLAVEDSNLSVQIAAARRVLSEEPGGAKWIETRPTRGYRFVGPPVTKRETAAGSEILFGHPARPDVADASPPVEPLGNAAVAEPVKPR
jgi:DNA-binding winged helix-turn-helix (wHTH) protein